MMRPMVYMVRSMASRTMVQLSRRRKAAVMMAPKTPTAAASVTEAMPP